MPARAVGVPVLPLGVAVEVDAIVAVRADPLDPGPAGFAHRGLHHGSGFSRKQPDRLCRGAGDRARASNATCG